MKKNIYSLAVLAAGVLWGSIGFFRRTMDSMGFSALGAVSVRCIVAFMLFSFILAKKNPKGFVVKKNDIWIFLGTGIIALLVFSACYFTAIQLMSLSAAAVLLYTAPCFVVLLSAVLFSEKLTLRKIVAVIISFVGCAFVSGLGTGSLYFSTKGLILGIMSGICYALYSIFSRFALDRGYDSLTINVYSTLLAGVGAFIFDGFKGLPLMFSSPFNLFFCIVAAVVTCFLPYLTYTFGLKGMENGKASVLASVEPVVATVFGVVIFKENITGLGILGVVLVLSGIGIMSLKGGQE